MDEIRERWLLWKPYTRKLSRRISLAIGRAYRQGFYNKPVTQLSDEELLSISNIGVKSLKEIRRLLPKPGSLRWYIKRLVERMNEHFTDWR